MKTYLLCFRHSDGSAFNVCGVTNNLQAALAWFRAGSTEHLVSDVTIDQFKDWDASYQPWGAENKA